MCIVLLHTGCSDWGKWGPGILERRAGDKIKGSQKEVVSRKRRWCGKRRVKILVRGKVLKVREDPGDQRAVCRRIPGDGLPGWTVMSLLGRKVET